MRRIREVLRLRAELGPSVSAISVGAKLARSTVRAYLDPATAAGLDAAAADGLSETALEAALYPPSHAGLGQRAVDPPTPQRFNQRGGRNREKLVRLRSGQSGRS